MGALTVKYLDSLTKPGRYGDGDGLWFQVRKPDPDRKKERQPAKSWIFRYTWQGRERALGLGPYPAIGLADARRAAQDAKRIVLARQDPIAVKRAREAEEKAQLAAMTFDGVLKLYLDAHESTWKNPKHRQQWRNTLDTYASPIFGDWQVQAVDTGAVMRVLDPIWKHKTETASRLRGRIEAVLDYAAARGWRAGENPARWRGHVENLLAKRSKVAAVKHHAALPWSEMAPFMAQLEQQDGIGALALRFAILTAARTGEVIGAKWSELDLSWREERQPDGSTRMVGRVWTVPAARMKAGKEHRVPLTDAAVAVLAAAPSRPESGDGFVFPGRAKGAGLSSMSLTAVLKRMERDDITVHGFRSTFRQWAGECTDVAREVAEAALAHSLRDKVEAAYQRSDLLERRRKLMETWAAHCAGAAPKNADVVPDRQHG